MGGRQIEIPEADTLLRERRVGPLDGFRSRLGKPFSASIHLNDANEVSFDFGDGSSDDNAEPPDFTGQEPLGPCPKCHSRVFETAQAYVCEKAVGPDKTCDFRSGRVILQRPVERNEMQKLLATGKTGLLQFVSARTKRAFSAFLVRQPDGKIGFEFEPRDPTKGGGRRARGAAPALRVLGAHPRDKKPVELHAGRYGPYVKHGDLNATVPDRDKVDALTLDDAVKLLDEKATKQGFGATTSRPRRTPPKTAAEPRASYGVAAKTRKSAAAQPAAPNIKTTRKVTAKAAPKPRPRTTPKTAPKTAPTTRAKASAKGRRMAAK
jgi:DNA topoisomerase-3